MKSVLTDPSDSLWKHNRHITLASIPEDSKLALKQLLKRNKLFDFFTIGISWFVLIFLIIISGLFYKNFFSAIVFIIIQGFLLHNVFELIHEYHVHSKTRYSYLNYVTALLSPFSPTLYKKIIFIIIITFPMKQVTQTLQQILLKQNLKKL